MKLPLKEAVFQQRAVYEVKEWVIALVALTLCVIRIMNRVRV
jgi:hypothetical protein